MSSLADGDLRTTQFSRFDAAGWRGRVADGWPGPTDADPLVWLMHQPHQVVRDRASSRVICVHVDDRTVYAKHMTGLRDRPGPQPNWLLGLKWRLRPARPLWVLRMHRAMRRHGLHAPPVLLAVRRRGPKGIEDLLVTEAVQGITLHHALHEADAERRRELLGRVGSEVRRLHAARFAHGDLLPGNILLADDVPPRDRSARRVVFLDNERTFHWPIRLPWRMRERNLRQMLFRLRAYPWGDARAFVEAYFGVSALHASRRDGTGGQAASGTRSTSSGKLAANGTPSRRNRRRLARVLRYVRWRAMRRFGTTRPAPVKLTGIRDGEAKRTSNDATGR